MDLVITIYKEKLSPNTGEELIESLEKNQPKYKYNFENIQFISNKKIISVNPITLQPEYIR